MSRTGLSRGEVIDRAIRLVNEKGLSYLTVTTLSECLGIRKPSLYYHVSSIDEVIEEIMIYGWKKVSNDLVMESYDKDPYKALGNYAHAFYSFALANSGVFEAMLWYNKYKSEKLIEATEGLYKFFFEQTDKLGISREIANHLLRTYRAFMEGFIMLEAHHSFGNPISVEESFEVSLNVLLEGIRQYENRN